MVYPKTILLAMITVLLEQADQSNRYSNAPGGARTESRGGLIRVVVKPSDARGKATGPGGTGSVFREPTGIKPLPPAARATELPGAVTRVVVKLTDARDKATGPGASTEFSGGLPGLVPPPDVAQPNATAPDTGRYVFPGGLPGMVVTPVRDMEILEESYARVMEIRKHVVTDFEVADCTTTGDEMGNETTTIYCPVGCAAHVKATVWGTGTYKWDSSMCRAAIHNGKLDDSAGGFVTVDKRPLGMMFPGSVRNGVRSTLAVINANRFPKGDKKSFVLRKYKFGE
ncbi:PREDICTED: uncharacterized protein LOC109475124 [Branchiostoma belcheri]|uniref:Uncharacterized protein LOC109475124 n=1 Tax=Branchiostoma belcheri TaxID=7741 RepID=A0A6P4ZBF1_BRABE|nr:PREDICTED: uncharacterized protein LOC109475124 [Branchiostoma belcheri]